MLSNQNHSMGKPTKPFRWSLFFARTIGGFTIVVLWVVRDGLRHDFIGVSAALLLGIAMSVTCYFWVRS